MASFQSGPGQHAMTVSSGSSVRFVVDISSSSDSVEATSRPPAATRVARRRRPVRSPGAASTDTGGGGDTTSRPRSAARRRRPSSSPVRSPGAASTDTGGGGGDATSRPWSAARRRHPSSPASVSVGSSDRSAGDEAISRRKYNKWSQQDEREVIDAMGHLRKRNHGEIPRVSLIHKEVLGKRTFERRGLKAKELSSKIYWLKRKFAMSEDKAAANYNGKLMRKTKYREKKLHKMSLDHELWPDVAADDGAAYLEARGIPRRPRRRKI